ncbi:MAG: hypothetical protein R3320_03960 [Nitriliruptorales bacterium]|nr:hypothetical protein [Nitriliruptorales bacterium]
MAERFDRGAAAAEAELERLDDEADERTEQTSSPLTLEDRSVVTGDDSIHIEDEWFPAEDDGTEEPDDAIPDRHTELTNLVEAFADLFNARDLDGLIELAADDCETPGLGNDIDNFPEAIEDLWERRPTTLVTCGVLRERPVGVLWELSDDESWWRVAALHFSEVRDGSAGVIAFSTDGNQLEEVRADGPDGDVDEGTRWTEWEEGASADA